MIESLRGLVRKKGELCLTLSQGPIDWGLLSTSFSLSQWPLDAKVEVLTVPLIKEEQWQMAAFSSQSEREVFKKLLGISGVGSRLALRILSAVNYRQFLDLLAQRNLDALCALPGLGKKTAQKILLSLEGQLILQEESKKTENEPYKDLSHSLVEMGFSKDRVKNVLSVLLEDPQFSSMAREQREAWLLKQALQKLSAL